jgi:hypothetical protein
VTLPATTRVEFDSSATERRSASRENLSFRELIQETQVLAARIRRLLEDPICEKCTSELIRVRMARAHTLSLLDELAELADPREHGPVKAVARNDDKTDGAASEVRSTTSSR